MIGTIRKNFFMINKVHYFVECQTSSQITLKECAPQILDANPSQTINRILT